MKHGRIGIIFLLSTFLLPGLLDAQNLIPNNSFEIPLNFNKRSPSNWIKCLKSDTPDYFCFHGENSNKEQLASFLGGIPPAEGNSYVGIFCYRTNPYRGITDVREFIQIKLMEPLLRDSVYQLSLYVALDPESNVAINNFNVYFGREAIKRKREIQMYSLTPQVSFRKNYYRNYGWEKLEYEYKAKGYERYLVLGNFLSDKRVKTKDVNTNNPDYLNLKWNLAPQEKASYYYIDNLNLQLKKPGTLSDIPEKAPQLVVEEDADTSGFNIKEIEVGTPVVLRNILFEFDKDVLLPASYKELNRLFKFLSENSGIKIAIEGHTDNIGSYEYNMNLSLRRAKAVVAYLIEKGISKERLSYEGYGYTRPYVDNLSNENRQLNRRVAFRIIK